MFFISIVTLTALAIAACAAFFSIHGLAQIFVGAFWGVVIMASVLELGKLVTASFVYRYWDKISWLMKTYLISAVIVLMTITSAGIFGYLSAGYQKNVLELERNEQRIEQLQQKLDRTADTREQYQSRLDEINQRIDDLPDDYVTARRELREELNPEIKQIRDQIDQVNDQRNEIDQQIAELESKQLDQEVHVGPVTFIADVFGVEINDTTKWLVILIMFAFDPLAVILVIGANIAILHKEEEGTLWTPFSSLFNKADRIVESTKDNYEDVEVDEPTPSIETVDDLFNEFADIDVVTSQEVHDIIREYRSGEQLSDEHAAQINQLLKKAQLKNKVRNPVDN